MGLAVAGMRVLVADIDLESAARVADEIASRAGAASAARVDATSSPSLDALAAMAMSELGEVHVLVSTVGVVTDVPLTEASEAEWAWFVEFHLMSAVRCVNAFVPLLRAQSDGAQIVVTSSMAGLLASPPSHSGGVHVGLYTVMKHALVGYAEMLRGELEPEGIGVSVLCPGPVESNAVATSARHRPERFGGPMEEIVAGDLPGAMPNEEVGPIVVRGIVANRAYIFTHPRTGRAVRARQDAVMADFAFFAEDDRDQAQV
jgi:NAD(P)-dependent dehydrogenase (short-subunit alcohol dehydrogenase family)